ncbi:ATP-binding protein [Streptomyces lunaelactis]|nr:ATP-binding protein [Streptomyces lunaelactis]
MYGSSVAGSLPLKRVEVLQRSGACRTDRLSGLRSSTGRYRPDRLCHVRRIVTALLSHWELDHLVADGALVATELVSNVRHAGDPSYELTLHKTAGELHIEVRDSGSVLPKVPPNPPGYLEESGRGLHLVSALASEIAAPLLEGKSIWVTLAEPAQTL